MIVQSIRLKNVKSYGEGRDGLGVTVAFQPGVNCVAGGNGHGKTTLVEALGYALFLTEPEFEERFSLGTYLLRAGKSAAEIDVTFLQNGESYRVERGLGLQSKRRSKVVSASDESTCSLDDAEVSAFLCRLLGFKEHAQLSELFSKLVGVRQGRLTWPFDSKPAAAKEYFEPLLEVAVFRECAERLSDAQRRFEALLAEQQVKLATIEERIRERADSREKLIACEQQETDLAKQLVTARTTNEEAGKQKRFHEEKESNLNVVKGRLAEARSRLDLASQSRVVEQSRVNESREASHVVRRTEPGFAAYLKAERRLRELQKQQQEKSRLQSCRAEAANARTALGAKVEATRRQASDYESQRSIRADQSKALGRQIEQVRAALDQTRPTFESFSQSTAEAQKAWSAVLAWSERLTGEVQDIQERTENHLKDWERIRAFDPQTVHHARAEEQRLDALAQEAARKLARVEEAKETLSAQLKQIAGGVCPFLQEQCRQFDPAKVQSDVSAREKELGELRNQRQESTEALKSARQSLRQITGQEAALAELRTVLRRGVESLLEQHNQLFPPAVRNQLDVIESYLGGQPRFAQLRLLDAIEPNDCWDASYSSLDAGILQAAALSEKGLLKSVSDALRLADGQLSESFNRFEKESGDRVRQQHEWVNEQKQLERIEMEQRELAAKVAALTEVATKGESQVLTETSRIHELDEKLKVFATLELDLHQQQQIQDEYAADHKAYLGAKPLADRLTACVQALNQASEVESQAQAQERQSAEKFEQASREFDPTGLKNSRDAAAVAAVSVAMAEKSVQDAQHELKAERKRFNEWQQACREQEGIAREIGRLKAASGLAKLASGVLKASAPAVAQNLCNRIAASAQRIFNQINLEPVELQWNAEPQYGLRIIPSDRRFAMLSGGEQTKLAVAMTLAMLQQFSSLRFAVFDEPTYAVDAESRPKLAEAILEAQKAAGLDQLIIVSHDNAFEGKIEHVIEVRKRAGTGTEVVSSG